MDGRAIKGAPLIAVNLRHLTCIYENGSNPVTAVNALSLRVDAGGFTAIVGSSGCGKTSLLRLIAGLRTPNDGTIEFEGVRQDRARGVSALVFQDARLLPWLTVEKNLLLALRSEHVPEEDARRRIRDAATLVHMEKRLASYPRHLSGGMAQRINLARALCQNRSLWLLDEPFGALDAFTRLQLQQELDRLWKERQPTIFLVTHDIGEAVLLADRVLTMNEGTIVHDIAITLERPRQRTASAFAENVAQIEESIMRSQISSASREHRCEAPHQRGKT